MKQRLIGYVGIGDLKDVIPEDIELLDGINLAFGKVENNVVVSELEAVRSELERIHALKPELKIVLSVGGWGAGGFSEAAYTKEGRSSFAKSCREIVDKYKLDGIDIDWEYPCISIAGIKAAPEDKENFTELLKEIRQELDRDADRHYLLSIAGGGDRYYTRCTELGKASEYLDYVQLMSYDLRGGFSLQSGHHTNLFSNQADLQNASTDEGVKAYLEAGVPREKLVIGVAFYSRWWKGVPDINHGWMQYAQEAGLYGPDYGELKEKYINKNGYTRYWDDEAKAPYLFNGDTFISYDDEESIAEKVKYVREEGLAGVMYWEYKCDSTHTLMQALGNAMKGE